MRAWVLVAGLVAVGLAGCIGSDPGGDDGSPGASGAPGQGIDAALLSTDAYGILPPVREYVESSLDGILLHGEVYLPDGDGPWPTIMRLSPYHLHLTSPVGVGFAGEDLVIRYVPKGYAVVVADVRGTGDSEGCLEMMGNRERQDAHDLVEWIAAQDWSDGKVALQGVSYEGTTPHEALVMAPEHLVTIVSVAGVTNQWRNTFQNGVPYDGRFYPLTYNAFGAAPPSDLLRGPDAIVNAANAVCGQEDGVAAMSPGTYEKGVYDAYWEERNQTLFVGQANGHTASMLYSQGFIDRAVNPSEAVHWFNELDIPKKAFFHQAGHQYPPRDDYFDTELAWFDFWLKGIDNGVMDTPQVEVQLNTDDIRTGTTWPPTRDEVATLRFYLEPGGLTANVSSDGSQSYVADALRNPVTGMPTDDALDTAIDALTGLPTSLAYESAPIQSDIHLAGSAWMHLVGSVDAGNTYWLFDLFDVAPDGGQTWIAEGWFNAHLRDGFDQSRPLTPGELYDFDFRFEPREYIFAEGHILRLELNGHDGGVLPFDQPLTENTVYYGKAGSYLELPVLVDAVVWERPEGV